MKRFKFASLLIVLSLVLAACAPAAPAAPAATEPPAAPAPTNTPMPEPTPVPTEVPPQTIVDIAAADGRFTTLVAAVEAAGLVDTLKGDGPFTVFAPTDDAFAKLPAGTVDALLRDIPALTSILLYHVLPGSYMAADVLKMPFADTAGGPFVRFKADGGKVFINEAEIILTDIVAENGVIHVIDSVILPPDKDIVDTAVADGRFTTLAAALGAAGLVDTLKGEGPFTVFAPTDDAFAKLPAGTVEALLADIPTLTNILLYHVVPGKYTSADVSGMSSTETALGQYVKIQAPMEDVMINNSKIVITDIQTTNGVIHVIDSVLLPPDKDIVDTAVADGRFTTLAAALGSRRPG